MHVLGGFQVRVGGQVVAEPQWRLRKSRALVKLLAVSPGHRLHREVVLDSLWRELTPRAATNNLHYAVHVARRALGAGALRVTRESVALAEGTWVDAGAFEAAAEQVRLAGAPKEQPETARVAGVEDIGEVDQIERALALYGGELLPEDRYEEWALGPRERLRETYVWLLMRLAEVEQRAGRPERAVTALERAVAADVTREESHVALMEVLASMDQREKALRQYQQLRAELRRQLDAEPGLAARQLYETLRGRPAALPQALTAFVGREAQLEAVAAALRRSRLVTLTGPGGVGKSRLALEAARRLTLEFPAGVCLVELADLAPRAGLPRVTDAIAAALRAEREHPSGDALEACAERIGSGTTLLLMDNCEHVLEACAQATTALLRACPHLRVLATTQQALGVLGETVLVVPPMALPVDGVPGATSEALRLFEERARSVLPEFALSAENAGSVARICRQLDGLPLAIELAAARMGTHSLERLAVGLDARFALLTEGNRAGLARHQTLRSLVDWSFGLLDEGERMAFQRLSVFPGGFTPEAAEAVCGANTEVLATLVARSLVTRVSRGSGVAVRFRLLETLRQYGAEELAARGEEAEVRRRHAVYYCQLAQEVAPQIFGSGQAETLAHLEQERLNFVAALEWSVVQSEPEIGLRLAAEVIALWNARGQFKEGRGWLEALLALPSRAAPGDEEAMKTRAYALGAAATLARVQGDAAVARARYGEALTIWQTLGNEHHIASNLLGLGLTDQAAGDLRAARRALEESLRLARATGSGHEIAMALFSLGRVWDAEGRLEQAEALLQESLALHEALGNRLASLWPLTGLGVLALHRSNLGEAERVMERCLTVAREVGDPRAEGDALVNLGSVALRRGDYARAGRLLKESITLFHEIGVKAGIAECLEHLGAMALEGAAPHRAALLLGAAEGLREAVHTDPRRALWRYDEFVSPLRTRVFEAGLQATWAAARRLPLDTAVREAMAA